MKQGIDTRKQPDLFTENTTTMARLSYLRDEIAHHNNLYYSLNAPEISDSHYDRLVNEFRSLEAQLGLPPDTDSPLAKVGDDRLPEFPSYRHVQPMMSLDNTYNERELRAFDERLRKLSGDTDPTYVVEPKIDGLAISLTYEHGKLVRAVTRGNGTEGDVVTSNILTIGNLPRILTDSHHPAFMEIRGEVFMTHEEFQRINEERQSADLPLYANPRNLAAGTVKMLDASLVAKRRLQIVLYGLGACEPPIFAKQSEIHKAIRDWGLPASETVFTIRGINAAWEAVNTIDQLRKNFPFPTDGAVIKLDDLAGQKLAGATSKAPRWAIAYKFAAEQAQTKVERITLQIGRTGVLTPVAYLHPVILAGSTVSKATLHNEDEILRKDIREGDTVVVEKAGEIIPAVVRVVVENRPSDARPFDFAALVAKMGFRAHRQPGEAAWRLSESASEHPDRLIRRLSHFAGRQAMDIEGLGKVAISQLVNNGFVRNIADIYSLRITDLLNLEGFAQKSAENLLASIQASKTRELWRFLHGLGIPHVGARAARDLAAAFPSSDLLQNATEEQLTAIDGIGTVVAKSIVAFFADEQNQNLLHRLLVPGGLSPRSPAALPPSDSDTEAKKPANPIFGKSFVITGTLPNLTRDEAGAWIEERGGRVSGSVSRKTDYLVAGESAGSKLAKAKELGIPVISEGDLLDLEINPTA